PQGACRVRGRPPPDCRGTLSCRSRWGDRGAAPLHERSRALAVVRAPVAYRARQTWALVHGDEPAPQGEKHWRREPGGVVVDADRKGRPRTVAYCPLDPYGAIRSAAIPATCAPAVARYLRCHSAARVLAQGWSANSLAVLP